MTEYQWFFLGTLLCFAGFLRWPRQSWELLRPRFVVPIAMWMATFAQFLFESDYQEFYRRYLVANRGQAMAFVCLCVSGFWLGHTLPIGRWVANTLFSRLDASLTFNPSKLRAPGIVLGFSVLGILLLLSGVSVVSADFHYGNYATVLPSWLATPLAVSVDGFASLSAIMIGLAWPERGRRNIFNVGLSLLSVFAASQIFMSRFSRGSGLLFLLLFLAISLRLRRISWFWGGVTLLLAMFLADAGLTGRDNYGHFSGSLNFFTQFFTYSLFDWSGASNALIHAVDSLTPTSVCIYGMEHGGIGEMPVISWILMQTPVPRLLGLPQWTADPSLVISSNRSWFTPSMFGDVYAHLHFAGFFAFVYMGVLYRIVDQVAWGFEREGRGGFWFCAQTADGRAWTGAWTQHLMTLNLWAIWLCASYGALARGLFNTYRAWNVMFFYPLYAIFLLLLLRRLLRPTS
jgi:hypothetical protein